MKSLYKVLKPDQTVMDGARVKAYIPPHVDEKETPAASPDTEEEPDAGRNRYALISEEKRKILDHARDQARRSAAAILEDAYAQRDKIINTAEQEAERIREEARKEGRAQGAAVAEKELAEALADLNQSVQEMNSQIEKGEEELRQEVTDLSVAIAEKILHKKIEEDGTQIADLAEHAVLSERDKNNILIHVSNRCAGLAEELEQRFKTMRDGAGNAVKIKTEDMPAGYVRVETEAGIVDASLEMQIENLKRQLAAADRR